MRQLGLWLWVGLAPGERPAESLVVDQKPVPARFSAALPVPDAQGRLDFDDSHPPLSHVLAALRRADHGMVERWVASVRASPAPREVAEQSWLRLLEGADFTGCATYRALARESVAEDAELMGALEQAACTTVDRRTDPFAGHTVDQLVSCVERERWDAHLCLGALAGVDRRRAVKLARAHADLQPESGHLRRFGKPGQLGEALRRTGLVAEDDPVAADAIHPLDALVDARRLRTAHVRSGTVPIEHDALLVDLANIARPDLDGALFMEEAPPADGPGPYTLHGWHAGVHVQVAARSDQGDRYDVGAMALLVDTLLEQTGSARRMVRLKPDPTELHMLVATPRARDRAAAAGLIVLGSP